MDNRQKAAVLAGAGAVICGTGVALRSGHGDASLGLSADFWRGFPLGMGMVFIIAAAVLLIKSKGAAAR